jgi:predicted phosphate transport protein (TIGR00153 family)
MRAIAGLFGKSPFSPLQAHMSKVAECVSKLPDIFTALKNQKWDTVEKLAEEISKLEHKADLTKNDIRNQLPKSLFLPVEREVLLNMLSLQDSIADTAEDVAILFTLKKTGLDEKTLLQFEEFLNKNIKCFKMAFTIVQELHDLFQSSFGGMEAESVKAMTDDVAYKEHEIDLLQRKILKELLNSEQELTYSTFHQWMRILESISRISDLSEKLANCIRTILERR